MCFVQYTSAFSMPSDVLGCLWLGNEVRNFGTIHFCSFVIVFLFKMGFALAPEQSLKGESTGFQPGLCSSILFSKLM